jgi:hypothetical protein
MNIYLKFSCKWSIIDKPNYVFTTSPKMLVNLKSGRVINQITKGGSIGYILDGKFYTLFRVKQMLVKIKEDKIPF